MPDNKSCSCPDFVELHAKIAERISNKEWSVIVVESDSADEPSFAYTVGLHSLGHPELLVLGPIGLVGKNWFVNSVAKGIINGDVTVGLNKEFLKTTKGDMDIKLVELDTERAVLHDVYTVQLFQHYINERQDVRLLQILWPDQYGTLPTEPTWVGGPHQCMIPKGMYDDKDK